MAELNLNARMLTRADTFANWTSNNPLLKKGEIATVIIEGASGNTILFKIGDGNTKFNSLDWAKATASDVYDWAKAESKPTYTSTEVGAVSYTNQTLTDAQKTQARENIGALSATTDAETVSTLGILKSITASATDNDIPTAKAVYNYVSAQTGADSSIYTATGINPPATGNFYLGSSSTPAYRAYVKETYSDRIVPYTGTEVKVGSYETPYTFATGKLTADTSSSTAITATGVDNFTLYVPNKLASPTSAVYRYSTLTFTTQLSGGPQGTGSKEQSLIWGFDTAITAALRPKDMVYSASLGTNACPWYQLYLNNTPNAGIRKLGANRSGMSEASFTDSFVIEHQAMNPSTASLFMGTGTVDLIAHGTYGTSGTTKSSTGGLRIFVNASSTSANNVNIIPIFSNTEIGSGDSYLGTNSYPWKYGYIKTIYSDKLYNKANNDYKRVPVFWGNSSTLPSSGVATNDICYTIDSVSSGSTTKTYVRPKIYYGAWRDTEADYIVDYYNDDSCRWVKWASGRMEVWRYYWVGTISASNWQAWGNIYEAKISTGLNWNVTFTAHGSSSFTPPLVVGSLYSDTAVLWLKMVKPTNTRSGELWACCAGGIQRDGVQLSLHAQGWWK